jgi:hypothetical protein
MYVSLCSFEYTRNRKQKKWQETSDIYIYIYYCILHVKYKSDNSLGHFPLLMSDIRYQITLRYVLPNMLFCSRTKLVATATLKPRPAAPAWLGLGSRSRSGSGSGSGIRVGSGSGSGLGLFEIG